VTALYRFWGRRNPEGRVKPPILAKVPGGSVDEAGVATVRLYDPIDSWGGYWGVSAQEFLATLDQLGDATQIRLHINSPGGEVHEAIAILNALRQHQARVTAIVDGLAASAASFIACGANELVMSQNTELMIHDAWSIEIGPAAAMHKMGDRLDQVSNNVASIYAKKSGKSTEECRAVMLAETWYSAQEAVDAGLADSVDTGTGSAGDDAQNRWDLSIYQHAGREKAPDPVLIPEPAAKFDVNNVIEALKGAFK